MQTEHDDPNFEVRTIFTKSENSINYETKIKKSGTWEWSGLSEMKKGAKKAIGYLVRNAKGYIELKLSKNVEIPKDELSKALLQHVGVDTSKLDHALWEKIPEKIADKIASDLLDSCQKAQKQVYKSSEGKILGAVFAVDEMMVEQSWQVKFSNVEFSSVSKEPNSGNDIAVLLHVTDGQGKSAIKTLWFQAKKDASSNKADDEHSELEEQLAVMRNITAASYPLFLTPTKIYVKENLGDTDKIDLYKFIADAVRCKYGDKREEVFAESVDRSTIFEVAIKKINKPKKIAAHDIEQEKITKAAPSQVQPKSSKKENLAGAALEKVGKTNTQKAPAKAKSAKPKVTDAIRKKRGKLATGKLSKADPVKKSNKTKL